MSDLYRRCALIAFGVGALGIAGGLVAMVLNVGHGDMAMAVSLVQIGVGYGCVRLARRETAS